MSLKQDMKTAVVTREAHWSHLRKLKISVWVNILLGVVAFFLGCVVGLINKPVGMAFLAAWPLCWLIAFIQRIRVSFNTTS